MGFSALWGVRLGSGTWLPLLQVVWLESRHGNSCTVSPGCNQNCQFVEVVKCQGGVSKQLSCNSSSAELALMSCSLAAGRTLCAKL